jgi:hypothetical protein
MPELKKATLQKLKVKPDESHKPFVDRNGKEAPLIPVQFNPASLKLTLSNNVSDGNTRGLQERQFNGKSSTELAFDLEFDTADEAGSSGGFRSVRERTAEVEQFVLPDKDEKGKVVPARVRFHWGELTIDGVIKSLTLDFDHFAPDGAPLHAKMSVSIHEQNADYEIKQSSEGQGSPAPPPGNKGSGAPGGQRDGSRDNDQIGIALGGESAADFAARMGLDPAAWRAVSGNLDGTLSLNAGAQIDFNLSASASVGLGVSVGAEAGVSASLDASFGLDASAGLAVGGSASAEISAGFALSAAGGVSAALESVAIVKTETAAADARRAFAAPASSPPPPAQGTRAGLPPAPSVGLASLPSATAALLTLPSAGSAVLPIRPAMPDQPRAPLTKTGMPSPSQQQATPSAPPPPLADTRAKSYGFGVPLRPRIGGVANLRAGAIAGRIALRPHFAVAEAPIEFDPTAPPWEQLPAAAPARSFADAAQIRFRPPHLCGCVGACSHVRGKSCP